jgi:hypothetical protein
MHFGNIQIVIEQDVVPAIALKQLFPEDGKTPEIDNSFKDEEQPAGERRILCALCGHGITSPDARIAVDGSHSHTFVNPAGVVFRIGCFSAAGGCLVAGEPTMEFTWFRGHSWRFAVCGNCHKHLGWHFRTGDGGAFFGLMLDSITEPD